MGRGAVNLRAWREGKEGARKVRVGEEESEGNGRQEKRACCTL